MKFNRTALIALGAAVIAAVPLTVNLAGRSAAAEDFDPYALENAVIVLEQDSYTYTGSQIEPQIMSVSCGDSELVRDRDFTVSYENNTAVGADTASVRIDGLGEYTGSGSRSFAIAPAVKQISRMTTQNDAITVSWQTDDTALAYQVLYSTTADFTGNVHSTTVTGRDYVNLSNIPAAGEKWYVKMRSFITDSGEVSGKRYGEYGSVKSITVKDSIRTVTIPYISYTYTGKAITPAVKVKGYGGRLLTEGKDYTLKYSSNVNVGTAQITVTGKGDIQGSYVKKFYVKPKKNTLLELSPNGKARFTAEWKADSTATGYQVLYSTDPDFVKDVHSYSTTKTRVTFTKYPGAGKTYYVKVRSYLAANGTRYGNYSAVKKVTTLVRDINTLKAQLTSAMNTYPGEWSVYVKNLRTQECIQINNRQYYAASLMKLFCMAATYDAIERGVISETATVKSYLNQMITVSSDDAFNRLVHIIGKTAVSDWIKKNGYTETLQYHGYGAGYDYAGTVIAYGYSNKTTAADCGRFFESVYNGECVSKEASRKMMALLKAQQVKYKAPAVIPAGIQTANKTGEVASNTHDCMLVFLDGDPYIFSVMSGIPGAGWQNAYHVRDLSKMTYEFFAKNKK